MTNSNSCHLRPARRGSRRRFWRAFAVVVLICYYFSWRYAWQFGLVAPCGNLSYYYFVVGDGYDERLDALLHAAFWPMLQLSRAIETTAWGASKVTHHFDRLPLSAEEMSGV